MKKICLSFVLTICLLYGLAHVVEAKDQKPFQGQTLTIYNVEDYISQTDDEEEGYVDLLRIFEEETGAKVNYYTYDTNETMYNQFKLQKEGTFDLICTSDYMIQKMIKEGLLDKMDHSKIPNYEKYASGVLRKKLEEMEVEIEKSKEKVNLDQYASGYMWGTLGIVYDPEFVDSEDVKSWDVFWNENYKDLISIKNSIRDAFVVGLMHSYSKSDEFKNLQNAYLENPTEEAKKAYNKKIQEIFDFKLDGSASSNEENLKKIEVVKNELISVKKNIFGFEVDSGKNDIITGKIKMNLAYSGDAVYSIDTASQEADKYLEYYVPEDGSNIWYDAWTMPKGAKNKELAYAFLDFISDPKNAADNMNYIGYTPFVVCDDLFTLTSTWYGASDYCITNAYYASDESMVIYENKLYCIIKDKEEDLEVYPTNSEYFELCEWEETSYEEGDMVSYNGEIYNCLKDTENTSNPSLNEDFEKVEPYDLTFLFEGKISAGRRAYIYPYLGSSNQLQAQYPDQNIIARCAIMNDFGSFNDEVVIMWGQVKAYTNMVPFYVFLSICLVGFVSIVTIYFVRKNQLQKIKKQ